MSTKNLLVFLLKNYSLEFACTVSPNFELCAPLSISGASELRHASVFVPSNNLKDRESVTQKILKDCPSAVIRLRMAFMLS